MRAAAFALTVALVPTLFMPTVGMAQQENYRNCVDWVAADPAQALRDAEGWRDSGGGLAARHCRALALAALDDFSNAALEAESVAASMPPSDARANLLVQAGEFRMATGDPYGARAQFDAALLEAPNNADALEGRATALAATGDMQGAISDLNSVLSLEPGNVDALSLRAAALRQTGDLTGALADAENAVAYGPSSAVAYFERGAARAMSGDSYGAESDWQTAASLDPGGPMADLANNNLARLRQ